MLKSFISLSAPAELIEPDETDNPSIHSRLIGCHLSPQTIARFQECFGKAGRQQLQHPLQLARALVKAGRFEAALGAYQQALRDQGNNWMVMEETAQFLTFALRDALAGLEMAKAALACNPSCSADLWSTAGDSLYELGRVEEARQAYLRALRINPDDVRARRNLAFVHVRTKEYAEALRRIAEALALDKTGSFRDGLLQKQSEVLNLVSQRHKQEYQRRVNRISPRIDEPELGDKATGGKGFAPSDRMAAPPAHMSDSRSAATDVGG
jgi:tetratricopeptide (TPR) repeat protein